MIQSRPHSLSTSFRRKYSATIAFLLTGASIILPWALLFMWLGSLRAHSSPVFALVTNIGAFALYTVLLFLSQIIFKPTRTLFIGALTATVLLYYAALVLVHVDPSLTQTISMGFVIALLFGSTAAFHGYSFMFCEQNQKALVLGLNVGSVLTTLVDIGISTLGIERPVSAILQFCVWLVVIQGAIFLLSSTVNLTRRQNRIEGKRVIVRPAQTPLTEEHRIFERNVELDRVNEYDRTTREISGHKRDLIVALGSLVILFATTFAAFPHLIVHVEIDKTRASLFSNMPQETFTSVFCILLYYIAAAVGSSLPISVHPNSMMCGIIVLVVRSFLGLTLFSFANYYPNAISFSARAYKLPTIIFVVLNFAWGLTFGYMAKLFIAVAISSDNGKRSGRWVPIATSCGTLLGLSASLALLAASRDITKL